MYEFRLGWLGVSTDKRPRILDWMHVVSGLIPYDSHLSRVVVLFGGVEG